MKRKRRWLSAIIAALLLVTLIPETVFAEKAPEEMNGKEAAQQYGFPGMPEEYQLTEEERKDKEDTLAHHTVEELAETEPGKEYDEDTVYFPANDLPYAEEVAAAYGAKLDSFAYGIAVLKLDTDETSVIQAVTAGADMNTNLPVVYPNMITYLDDPKTGDQFFDHSKGSTAFSEKAGACDWDYWWNTVSVNDPALDIGFRDHQWYHDVVGTYAGWGVSRGNPDITVAVIDTDVLIDHEEFGGRAKRIEIGNMEDGEPYYDDNGHGTHCAGIIAAGLNNGHGGAGIAPNVSILGIPVFEKSGGAADSDVIRGINAAVENDADIISMSLGGPIYSAAYQEAVTNAYEKGVTVIAAMGNDGYNKKCYPAAYEHVIGVAATDESNHLSYYSCYGSWCDISAPGSDIYSSVCEPHGPSTAGSLATDQYDCWDGTSMATPVVSGVCALYMSIVGKVSPDQMESALKQGAVKCEDPGSGAGIVNLENMLKAAPEVRDKAAPEILAGGVAVSGNAKLQREDTLSFGTPSSATSATTGYVFTLDGSSPEIIDEKVKNGYYAKEGESFLVDDLLTSYGMRSQGPIRAVRISALGEISEEAAVSYSVSGDAGQIISIKICGQDNVIAGQKKVSYQVEATPQDARIGTVKWSLVEADPLVKINEKTGVLSVDSKATGSFTIRAEVGGDSKIMAEKAVSIVKKTGKITISPASALNFAVNTPKYSNGSLCSIRLYTTQIDSLGSTQTMVLLKGKTDSGAGVLWKSSKPSVATVGPDGTVRARSAGDTILTCTAADGSRKKTTVKVKVIIPSSGLHVDRHNETYIIGYGKSQKVLATLGKTYGKPSVAGVEWSYAVGTTFSETDPIGYPKNVVVDEGLNALFHSKKLASVKNGKLTVSSKARDYIANSRCFIEIRATAKDGTGHTDSYAYLIIPPAKSISLYLPEEGESTPYKGSSVNYSTLKVDDGYGAFAAKLSDDRDMYVVNSNPEVANVAKQEDQDNKGLYVFYIMPYKVGTIKVKLSAKDGSGVSKTLTVKIKESDLN